MMKVSHSRLLTGRRRATLGALIAALALLLVASTSVFAATVNLYDNAHVLNSSRINSEASSLSYPISIYTVANYTASTSAFDQSTANKVTSKNLIVMAINTTQGHGHVRVDGGSSVPLTSSDYQNAASVFASNYNNGDYNGATVAAIHSLRDALSSSRSSGGALPGSGSGGSFFGSGALCCIGLLVLAGIAFFVIIRRRSRPGMGFGGRGFGGLFNRNRNMPPPGYDPNYYNQPYGQGPYNQPYPPNYGPNYGNRGGMNPWAAGGLGAAAGGLLGYELGKEQGENENRQQGDQGGDFGGGGGADFDNNSGGGGDFGGGADFGGGGGDSGGGGGSDF